MPKVFTAVLLFLGLVLSAHAAAGEPRRITVQQAHDMAASGDILLVDVRSPVEWRETGLAKGAHAISMHLPDFMQRLEALTGGDKSTPLALICARGARSGVMSGELVRRGYRDIIDVPEGMLGSARGPGWLKAQLPIEPYPKTP